MSRDLSLMPSGQKNAGAVLPSKPTMRILLICAGLIVLALVARWQINSQLASETTSLKEAQSQQKQLELRSQSMQKQLGELQTAGGASRIDLVKGLTKARVDWKSVVLAVARESSPGLTISSFNGTAPVAPGSGGEEAPAGQSDIQLSGEAANREQLQAFVKRLRANKKIFLDVQLKKASSKEQGEPTEPGAAKAPKSEKVTWDMGLTLAPLPPMPPNGSSTEGAQQ